MLDIRRARLVDASTNIARTSRSPLWSYALSTSVTSRLSGGSRRSCLRKLENVSCRVLVAVVMCPALHAIELPHAESHRLVNVAARGATLGAWEESIRDTNFLPIPCGLVFEHPAELAEAGARDVFSERWQLNHAAHVQVLDGENIELADKPGSEFVERVFAGICNVRVMSRHPELLPPPSVAALLSTGKDSLKLCKLLRVSHCVSRVSHSLPRGERGQTRDSQVDPDLLSRLWERVLHLVEAKRHKISPGTVLCYRDCGGFARELAAPPDVKATDLGNCDVAVCRIPFETARGVFGGLLPVLALEAGELGAFREEVGVSCLQVPKRLLQRHTGDLVQELELRSLLLCGESSGRGVVVDRHAVLVTIRAETQRRIVGNTDATKRPSESRFLALARVEPECHACFHLQELYHSCKVCQPQTKAGLKPVVSTQNF